MPALATIRQQIRANYLPDEGEAVQRLAAATGLSVDERKAISRRAADLVRAVRGSSDPRLMEVFLSAYGLSTKEGVALMCLAEALLRVPDAETMDDLIADKIAPHDWSSHSGSSSSIFVNASTWALMLTGRVLDEGEGGIEGTLRSMVRRLGEPVIRKAVAAAMREMGEQFVLGRTIAEAVKRGKSMTQKGYLYSFDMLGEAARTEHDALRYLKAYADAIASLAPGAKGDDIRLNHGISVKLSALHPRYEVAQKETMLPVMADRPKRLIGSIFRSMSSSAFSPTRNLPTGTVSVSSCRPMARVLPSPSTGCTHWPPSSTARSWCGWSRAPIGTPRSSARRHSVLPAIRCSRAR